MLRVSALQRAAALAGAGLAAATAASAISGGNSGLEATKCEAAKCEAAKANTSDDMSAAVATIRNSLDAANPPGWKRLLRHFYPDEQRCIIGHLQETTYHGKLYPEAAHQRILDTLVYRKEHDSNRPWPKLASDIESARCRDYWPFAFAANAPDGSPVEICRLKNLDISRILSDFPEDEHAEVLHFFGLWCESCLRRLGASFRAGAPTKGSIHVWDCRDVSWLTLLSDANSHWHTVSLVFLLGQSHWPNLSSSYYVIYAPYTVHYLWKLIKPLTTEQTQQKVSFSKGVPDALVEALGSEDAVARMLECGESLREPSKRT